MSVNTVGDQDHVSVVYADPARSRRSMYGDYLAAAGCHVVLASDSIAALEHSVTLVPDLIMLSDRLRPLDARHFYERLKADARTSSIPVILLAASSKPIALATMDDRSCDVLLKPRVPPETLFRTVRETVACSRALLSRARQAADRSRHLIGRTDQRRSTAPGADATPPESQFDARGFLDSPNAAERVVAYRRGDLVYTQGSVCDSVLYLRTGLIKLSVTSRDGRECVVAVLGPGDFFGEECLAGESSRSASAAALAASTVLCLDSVELQRLIHTHHELAHRFIRHMLARNARAENDLVDQLFNSSEKRLARRLLLMAGDAEQEGRVRPIPRISQSTLAEMVGTTRSRINLFMRKFERLGAIEYGRGLKVNVELLSALLDD